MKTIIKTKASWIKNALIALYVILVLGFAATAKAQMSVMPIFPEPETVQTQTHAGEIAMTVDGRFYLIVSDSVYFELLSNIDLSEYADAYVEVVGVELQHKVGPVYELTGKPESAPALVVLGISEVTL